MRYITITFILLLCFFHIDLSATHIVAGFSSYEHLNDNSYQISYTLIRDNLSGGANFDEDIFVQVYSFNGFNYTFKGNLMVPMGDIKEVTHGVQQSEADEFSISLSQVEYKFEYQLQEDSVDYVFVHQRCCRVPTISNILGTDEGITLSTTITKEAQALQNSSIKLDRLPNFIAIANEEQLYPIDAISIDGDTILYQFSPIYYGGGLDGTTGLGSPTDCTGVTPTGPCPPPYQQGSFSFTEGAFNTPFPAWDNAGLEPSNGTLLGIPTEVGLFSYGFQIHEIRNGLIINSTAFDYIVYVVPTVVSTNEIGHDKIKIAGNPSSNGFTLENQLDQELSYQVFNLKGEKISNRIERSGSIVKIDFDGPSGMYILKAFNEEYNQNLKLIKVD